MLVTGSNFTSQGISSAQTALPRIKRAIVHADSGIFRRRKLRCGPLWPRPTRLFPTSSHHV